MPNLADPLASIIAHTPPWEAQALEGAVRAWTERVVDAVFDGRRAALESEFDTLRRSYRLLSAHLSAQSEDQPEFFLGRVASLLEVAGSAHQRIRPDEWEETLRDQMNQEIVRLLRRDNLRPTDVAEKLGLDISTASKRLSALAEARVVVPTRTGREVRYRLSRAVEEVVPLPPAGAAPLSRTPTKFIRKREAIQQPRAVAAYANG